MFELINAWEWPQWCIFAWLIYMLAYQAIKNGEEKVEITGTRKGLPEKYNFNLASIRAFLIVFFLSAGGFFG